MFHGVQSDIQSVTVFSEGARVRRTAALAFTDQWPEWVRIGGLPLSLDDSSVRVRVKGASLVAADTRVALEVPDMDEELAPAEDADLEETRAEEMRVKAKLEQVQRELSRLERLALKPRATPEQGPPPESPAESRVKLVGLRSQKLAELLEEVRKLQEEMRLIGDRRRELEDLEQRRTTARQAREHELRKSVLVRLEGNSGGATSGELELDYLVPGARWAPAYTVRIDAEDGQASVAMRANVLQASGEDWNGVDLTLSTADPVAFVALPELTSIRIGRRQPMPTRIGWRPPPTGTAELYSDYDNAFADDFVGAPLTPPPRPKSTTDVDPYDLDRETMPYLRAETSEDMVTGVLDYDDDEITVAVPPPEPASEVRSHPRTVRRSKEKKKKPTRERRASRDTELMNEAMASVVAKSVAPPAPMAAMASMPAMGAAAPPPDLSNAPGASFLDSSTEVFEAEVPATLRAADELLDYKSLTMPAARESGRGRLVHVERAEVYMRLLIERRIDVDFDVVRTVDEAVHRARSVAHRSPRAQSKVSVASDAHCHSVPVTVDTAAVDLRYVVVPRMATEVFRVATLTNPLRAPLLAGPADVYYGKDFLLTADLRVTPQGGEVELGLGVEQAIKVARNTRYGEDSAGLLGGSKALRHEIHIDVENHLGRKAAVEVRERIPTVREDEEDIKLEIGKVTPAWSPYDPFPNRPDDAKLKDGYRWQLDLAGGEKKELRVHYEVRISSKHELVGGNRREN
jgi:hypothetical protein